MGLLDALQNGGDPGGGLLAFLSSLQRGQAPSQMGPLPSDTAQYGQPAPMQAMAQAPILPQPNAQPSPLDNAQWPAGPMGAPSQANAQMVPQQPPPVIPAQPQQPISQEPGFGDRLMAGLQSFGNGSVLNGIQGFSSGQRADPGAQSQNVTKQWLQQRGVDPVAAQAAIANPEVLKSLIDQLKPKALINTGNGHLYDPNAKADIKTYTPDDKTPSGFIQNDDGTMHFAKGGPADPAYARLLATQGKDPKGNYTLGSGGEVVRNNPDGSVTVVHKNENADKQILTDDGVDLAANRIINGEKGVTTGFARSKADMGAVMNRVAELAKARGIDPKEILSNINNEVGAQSAARSSGGIISKMETFGRQTEKAIDIAEKASADVARGDWVPVNKVIQAWQNNTSNPKLAALGQSLETLTQEYARAVGGGHGTVSDKMEAREYLSKAQNHEALVARLNVMRQEIQRAREAAPEAASGTGKMYRDNIISGHTPSAVLPEPGAESPIQGSAPKAGAYIWMPGKGLVPKQ